MSAGVVRRLLWLAVAGCALVGCEEDPGSALVARPQSAWLGPPHRLDPEAPERTVDLMSLLVVPGPALVRQGPDSLSLMARGDAISLEARLPAVEPRDISSVRMRWRGTLGGELTIAWSERARRGRMRSLDAVPVPGGAIEQDVEIGFGPSRLLGPTIRDMSIEIPPTEIGPVTIANAELVLRPGRTLHRVAVDGQVREVFAPGPDRAMEWDVQVRANQAVSFEYATHPLMRAAHGDGTRFVAQVVAGRDTTVVHEEWLSIYAVPAHRTWRRARIDLSRWKGRTVTLRLTGISGPDRSGIFPASRLTRDDDPLFTVPRLVDGRDQRPNVLLIVIDTLRRDAPGGEGVSPALDSLAARSVRFARAWSPGSWTHPGTASLLSGWLPSAHGLGYGPAGTTSLSPEAPMVAEDFRAAGWLTAAASNNMLVSIEDGFGRGFSAFDERALEADQFLGAERITRAARDWLDKHADDGPFFLYLHYFDPHDRYQAPEPFTRRHVDEALRGRVHDQSVLAGRPNAFLETVNPDARVPGDGEIRYLHGLYLGEVSYVDHWIGRLLGHLEAAGRLDDTIVVVTSDHGEEFYEHGGLKHAHTLYEELLAVPLIVRLPGDRLGGTVRPEAVSLVALPATLRSLAGLPARVDDEPLALSGAPSRRPVVGENWWSESADRAGLQESLIEWPHKLIRYADGTAELFDLAADPGELSTLNDAGLLGRMTAALDSMLQDRGRSPVVRPPDPALLEKLKAMGYVH